MNFRDVYIRTFISTLIESYLLILTIKAAAFIASYSFTALINTSTLPFVYLISQATLIPDLTSVLASLQTRNSERDHNTEPDLELRP